MTLFERVSELAKKQHIGLKELAGEIGLSESAIYHWRTSSPKAETLQKVAEYFGVTTDYLLGREVEKEEKVSELSDDTLIMTLDGKEVSAADREIILAAARAVIAQREANNKNDK
ncbi:helix-turn-helix domain-containing protein [Enterococcus sp. BWR-S5]|uniref:helix-turn-helix domain-containing protein n=1 Tax=Enterococcus sp. BWR-S5 TaxID=2787714 RepID=UPI001924512B|nr:helix-turn-helix transcriptional regulator [Enterococcus sp. BWR-S5]MBL1223709.1 helix-turn-helix transcriptional regulator [Enterococcus sp. BWR-S5]